MLTRAVVVVFIALNLLLNETAHANDSAVDIAVGGLKLRKEHSVVIQKERLFISKNLVTVEYEFQNTTNTPVVSEVSFPIPSFHYIFDKGPRDFSDFTAWINGEPIDVKKEVRAFVKGREVTKDLHRAGIAIETFGNFDPSDPMSSTFALNPESRKKLVDIGALKNRDKKTPLEYWPEWEVHIKYHWTQEFPAKTLVHIKHVYKPVAGYSPVQIQKFKQEYKDTCVTNATFSEVKKRVADAMRLEPLGNNYFGVVWVSYILTTANTWQTPIKDFELLVQGENNDLPTFCWEGPIEKLDQNRLRAHKTDYVPKKDLKIYFLTNF